MDGFAIFTRRCIPTLLALSLAACGGGGGSTIPSGTSTGGGGSVGSGTTPAAAPVESVAVQRTLTSQALAGAESTDEVFTFGTTSTGGTFSVTRRAINAAAASVVRNYRPGMLTAPRGVRLATVAWSTCSNSTETATVQVSPTELQLYVRNFYDAACTQIYQDEYIDVIATSTTATTGTGTLTTYAQSGAVTSYDTLTMSLTNANTTNAAFSMQLSSAPNAQASPVAVVGVACGATPSSLGCGAGVVDHDQTANADQGATLTVNATATAQNGLTVISVTGNDAGYTGAFDALSLAAATPPSWTISGGSTTDSASLSGSLSFTSAGLATSGTLVLNDTVDEGSVSYTVTATGSTGSVTDTSTGKTVATFTVNQAGNGTLTLSNGTTAAISGFTITG